MPELTTCLITSASLSLFFFFLNWCKLRTFRILSFKELFCIIWATIGLWAFAIPSVGFFPAIIVQLISYPIYHALDISLGGDTGWGYMITASILFPLFIMPSYLMSNLFLSRRKYQLTLFFLFLFIFALMVGFVSVVPYEMWGIKIIQLFRYYFAS